MSSLFFWRLLFHVLVLLFQCICICSPVSLKLIICDLGTVFVLSHSAEVCRRKDNCFVYQMSVQNMQYIYIIQ